MRVKSYFTNTVEAALPLAVKELGDDAVLLYSREATPETRYLGRYEVVFASAAGDPAPPPARARPDPPPSPDWAGLVRRVESIERCLGMADGPPGKATAWAFDPATSTAYPLAPGEQERPWPAWKAELTALLRDADVEPSWIERLLDGLSPAGAEELNIESADKTRSAGPRPEPAAGLGMREALRRRMEEWAGGRRTPPVEAGPSVIAVTGPPGAGKTTSVVRLAAACRRRKRAWPLLISLPCPAPDRPEMEAGLAGWAALIGAPHQEVLSPEQLRELLGEAGATPLLIDAGPLSLSSPAGAAFAAALSAARATEVWLVLSAAQGTDLRLTVDSYRWLSPRRLVLTHLDRASHAGPLWSLAANSALPVACVSHGRRILDDFSEAGAPALVEWILRPPASAERMAPDNRLGVPAQEMPVTALGKAVSQ